MADTPFDVKLWAKDTAERALTTFVQAIIVFIPALLTGPKDPGLGMAIVAAVFPAVGSVLLSSVNRFLPIIKNYYLDLFVRSMRTFVATILGSVIASATDVFDPSKVRVLALAAGMAALAIVKGALAERFVKNTITPASLAKVA
jgi:hypothetical protein